MLGLPAETTGAIRLDAATLCQLKCPVCPTTLGTTKAEVGAGFLRFDAFRKLVDANPSLWRIELSNWGEIFLNPDLGHIVEYAYRRSVALTAWNGVNLNHVREGVLEGLARYRFRGMTCSIDGATQATYVAYRREGDLDQVLDNIRRLNAFKRRWKTSHPWLTWQMILFRHNAHEVEAARSLARELGMGFLLKTGIDPDLVPPPTGDAPGPAAQVPLPDAKDLALEYCTQLWDGPQVNFDGALLGCCINTKGRFGPNVFEVGLARALADDRMRHARRMLEGTAPPRPDVPCTTCHIYQLRARAGAWVDRTPQRGLVPFLRRRGLGRAVVWVGNRLERTPPAAAH